MSVRIFWWQNVRALIIVTQPLKVAHPMAHCPEHSKKSGETDHGPSRMPDFTSSSAWGCFGYLARFFRIAQEMRDGGTWLERAANRIGLCERSIRGSERLLLVVSLQWC